MQYPARHPWRTLDTHSPELVSSKGQMLSISEDGTRHFSPFLASVLRQVRLPGLVNKDIDDFSGYSIIEFQWLGHIFWLR